MDSKNRTIIVTGGAGFIGVHLCSRLLEEGNNVLCIDNFLTGSEANLSPFDDNPHFHLLRHDVTLPFSEEADMIYHLACPASPVQYQIDPVRTIRTAVLGTLNVLDLATRLDIPILQASTSEVYGDPEIHPQSETYNGNVNPLGPRACYDEGKRCAETLCINYHRQYRTKVKIARIFNTYGPGMQPDDGRVISNFILQALRNEDITIYGSGSQTRCFCYIDDLIEGLLKLMDTGSNITGPVNIGSPDEISIKELACLIIRLTGSKSRVLYRPIPEDDPKQRKPDISLVRKLTGWQPTTPLSEGLENTIAHFDSILSGQPV